MAKGVFNTARPNLHLLIGMLPSLCHFGYDITDPSRLKLVQNITPQNQQSQNTEANTRISALTHWITACYGQTPLSLTPLVKEASHRTYYRVHLQDHTLVAMDAPPATNDCNPFIKVAQTFTQCGIAVPTIHHHNLKSGFILLSDFGDQLLLNALNADTAETLYPTAINALLDIHRCTTIKDFATPSFNEEKLLIELHWFQQWYVEIFCGHDITSKQQQLWQDVQQHLIDNALSQPQVLLHKDYHSRNLMIMNDNHLGILDFQDALYGPITYDIASLLNDCYIDWPRDKVENWCALFQHQLQQANLLEFTSQQQFMRWFDLTSLQRHLKNLGNFVRICQQQNQQQYLNYLPRMCGYIDAICQRYTTLRPFHLWLQQLQATSPQQTTL